MTGQVSTGPALGSLALLLPSPELRVPASPSRSGDGGEEPCPQSLKGTPSISQCSLNYSERGQQTFPIQSQTVNIYTPWAARSPPLWTGRGLAGRSSRQAATPITRKWVCANETLFTNGRWTEGQDQGCGSLTTGLDFPGPWSSDSSAPQITWRTCENTGHRPPPVHRIQWGWVGRGPAFLTSSQGTVGEPLDRAWEEWGTVGSSLGPRLDLSCSPTSS